jgi:hypothetical protein
MKVTLFLFILITECAASCAQPGGQQKNSTPIKKVPVALDTLYKIPLPADEVLAGASHRLTTNELNGYITYISWYFRLVFSDKERTAYKEILVNNWNRSPDERKKITDGYNEYNRLIKLSGAAISGELNELLSATIWDDGFSGLTSNREPNTLSGKMKQAAERGDAEAKFVMNKINLSDKVLANGNNYNQPFTQGMADAFTEWITYMVNMVAGKQVIIPDEGQRKTMSDMVVKLWIRDISNTNNVTTGIGNEVSTAVREWDALKLKRTGDFSVFITNYNKLSKMVDAAKLAYFYCPSLKPYAEARQKEYADYAGKMSNDEWQLELYRLQGEMRATNMAISMMKEQQLKAHVINMNNALSFSGDPKYEWILKEKAY